MTLSFFIVELRCGRAVATIDQRPCTIQVPVKTIHAHLGRPTSAGGSTQVCRKWSYISQKPYDCMLSYHQMESYAATAVSESSGFRDMQLSGSVTFQTSPQTFKPRGFQTLSRIPMIPHRTPHRSTIFCKVFLRMANARRMLCYYLRPPRA